MTDGREASVVGGGQARLWVAAVISQVGLVSHPEFDGGLIRAFDQPECEGGEGEDQQRRRLEDGAADVTGVVHVTRGRNRGSTSAAVLTRAWARRCHAALRGQRGR
jgi:hypothetical protein